MIQIAIFNRQKIRSVNVRLLRQITRRLLAEWPEIKRHELAIHLIAPDEMTRMNHDFLGHKGSTDIITFDNSEPGEAGVLCGELFISIQDAISQAEEFHTTWQSELARYTAHGLLHLLGYDDLSPKPLHIMKREENRLVEMLMREFPLVQLEKTVLTPQ